MACLAQSASDKPVYQDRFCGVPDKPSTDKPVIRPVWYTQPFVRLAAYVYSHPKIFNLITYFLSGKGEKLMDPKYIALFQPIHPVDFTSADGVQLKGYWMPCKQPSTRTVLMGHGYTADWRELLAVAAPLRDAGYNIFLFDFRGHGNSQGHFCSIGYHEGKDIAGAVAFLAKQYPEATKQMAYLGHSMGASAFLLAPASLKGQPFYLDMLHQKVSAVILDSPYADLDEMAERYVKKIGQVSPKRRLLAWLISPLKRLAMDIILGLRTIATTYLCLDIPFATIRPAERYIEHKVPPKPMLIVHGTADRITPIAHAHQVFKTLKTHNPFVEMEALEGADHYVSSWDPVRNGNRFVSALRAPDRLIPRVLGFLDKSLSA